MIHSCMLSVNDWNNTANSPKHLPVLDKLAKISAEALKLCNQLNSLCQAIIRVLKTFKPCTNVQLTWGYKTAKLI